MARKRLDANLPERLYHGIVNLLSKSPEKQHFAFYRQLRPMGINGTLLDCPDIDSNRKTSGRPSYQASHGAFPKARVLSPCELGTRILWRSVIGNYRQGEQNLTLSLLKCLDPGMLLSADRHFGVAPTIYPLLARHVSFLVRVKKPVYSGREGSFGRFVSLRPSTSRKKVRRAGRRGKTVRTLTAIHIAPVAAKFMCW